MLSNCAREPPQTNQKLGRAAGSAGRNEMEPSKGSPAARDPRPSPAARHSRKHHSVDEDPGPNPMETRPAVKQLNQGRLIQELGTPARGVGS